MSDPTANYNADTDDTPSTVRCFGVDYSHERTTDGGDLWITRCGWPFREHLLPEHWFENSRYISEGRRLGFSTGHVYQMVSTIGTRRLALVIKVSRVAQPLSPNGLLDAASDSRTTFASPFEELGQLDELRKSEASRKYLFTKRPLCIFSPGERLPSWMFDRVRHEFEMTERRLKADPTRDPRAEGPTLEACRDYFTLFAWVDGYNLEELVKLGRLSPREMNELDREVRCRLDELGFMVADHKPNHIIVRLDARGVPRRRNGRLVAALADFELLEKIRPGDPVAR